MTEDIADRLRVRYECTAGFTHGIYFPEDRELDLLAARELDARQARIDALMVEYCFDEMTPEQYKRWEQYQRRRL